VEDSTLARTKTHLPTEGLGTRRIQPCSLGLGLLTQAILVLVPRLAVYFVCRTDDVLVWWNQDKEGFLLLLVDGQQEFRFARVLVSECEFRTECSLFKKTLSKSG
jgi:hypothetical protein